MGRERQVAPAARLPRVPQGARRRRARLEPRAGPAAGLARRLGADLFISIHADASPFNDGARGATIYTLSEVASDKEAALLAEQQNRSDRIAGTSLSGDAGVDRSLIDLAQRESMNVSAAAT